MRVAKIDDGGNLVKVTRLGFRRTIPGLLPVAVGRVHMIQWSLIFFLAFSLATPTISAGVIPEENSTHIKLRQDSDVNPEMLTLVNVLVSINRHLPGIFIPLGLARLMMRAPENSVLRSFMMKMLVCVNFAAQNTMLVLKMNEEELLNGEFDKIMWGFVIIFLIHLPPYLVLFLAMYSSP